MTKTPNTHVLILSSTFPRWVNDDEPPFVYELSKRLTKEFECTVLAPHTPNAKKNEDFDNLHVIRFQYLPKKLQTLAYEGGILPKLKQNKLYYLQVPFFLTAQLFSTIKILKNNSIDLIHAHWVIPQGLIALLARKVLRNKIPILCTLHGGDLYGLKGSILDKLKIYILKQSNGITVVSNTMKNDLINYGIHQSKIMVIPMGVDLRHNFTPTQAIKRIPHTILFVGRLVEKKGVKYLLNAIPEIIKHIPDARCTIAGSGPDETDLKNLASKLSINNKVNFLGTITNKDLPALFNQHSIIVFPSIIASSGDQEGFGLVLVEALGCECPIVATDLPAIHDIITHNKTAVITRPKDPAALADAVVKLMLDHEFAEKLGKEGRRYVLDKFDWDIISKRYVAYINTLLNNNE